MENIPFKIVRDNYVYLGPTIPKDPKLLYKLNFAEFLSKLKCNIDNWKILPLSMIGCIHSIQMISLPRFLIYLSKYSNFSYFRLFKELDSIILSYVWNYKTHRISKINLQKPRSVGGLGLPVFKHYYWAAKPMSNVSYEG